MLVATVPVLGHLGAFTADDPKDLLDCLLINDPSETSPGGVLAWNHDGHVVVLDPDGQVLARYAENRLLFLQDNLSRPVVWVYDRVTNLKDDVYKLDLNLKVVKLICGYCAVGNCVLLFIALPEWERGSNLQITVHEVYFLKPAQSLANVLGAQLSYSLD